MRLAGQGQGEFLRRRAEDWLPECKPERFELAVDVQRLDIAVNDREIGPPVVDGKGRVVGGERDRVMHVQVRIDPAAVRIHIGAKRLPVLDADPVPESQQVFIHDGSHQTIGTNPRCREVVVFKPSLDRPALSHPDVQHTFPAGLAWFQFCVDPLDALVGLKKPQPFLKRIHVHRRTGITLEPAGEIAGPEPKIAIHVNPAQCPFNNLKPEHSVHDRLIRHTVPEVL